MSGTTRAITIKTGEGQRNFAAPDRSFRLLSQIETPCSCGENSRMTADKPESTAPCSETKATISRLTLSERLTPLLISAGLVRGTTHTFALRLYNLGIQGIVSYAPDGSIAVTPKQGCLSLNERREK